MITGEFLSLDVCLCIFKTLFVIFRVIEEILILFSFSAFNIHIPPFNYIFSFFFVKWLHPFNMTYKSTVNNICSMITIKCCRNNRKHTTKTTANYPPVPFTVRIIRAEKIIIVIKRATEPITCILKNFVLRFIFI